MSNTVLNPDYLPNLIAQVVPKELMPNKKLESDSPILGIYLGTEEELLSHSKLSKTDLAKGDVLLGLTIDMFSLAKAAKSGSTKGLEGKYIIFLLDVLPYHYTGMVLVHEVGHVVGMRDYNDESETFAETWAIKRIASLDKMSITERMEFLKYSIYG
jgi:hypothetical protein